jgi:hypothetical protein
MDWENHHRRSERLAMEAQIALQQGEADTARRIYALAAEAENRALALLDPEKRRTLGITVVSAASLWFKAGDLARAWKLAMEWLSEEGIPPFACEQLEELLVAILGDGGMSFERTPFATPVSDKEIDKLENEIDSLYQQIREREQNQTSESESRYLTLLWSQLRELQEEEARAAFSQMIALSNVAVSVTARILERARRVLES